MTNNEYYSGREIRDRFGWSRQSLYATAKREGWRVQDWKRPYRFCKEDVENYTVSRRHSMQARLQGHHFRGLLRHTNGYNEFCPICNKLGDSAFNNSDSNNQNDSTVGHEESPLDNTIK